MRPFIVDHRGVPLEIPTPSPEEGTLEHSISASEFYDFCAEEAKKSSTKQEKHVEKF